MVNFEKPSAEQRVYDLLKGDLEGMERAALELEKAVESLRERRAQLEEELKEEKDEVIQVAMQGKLGRMESAIAIHEERIQKLREDIKEWELKLKESGMHILMELEEDKEKPQ